MRRVLLVQPSLQPPGGGNGVGAWVLQALVREHRVTVLTWQPVEIDSINRFFGTKLHRSEFEAIEIPARWRRTLDRMPVQAALMRASLLMRYTRLVSRDYDVLFGTHNEIDFGRRGIQYVHYPTYLRPRPDVDVRWWYHFGVGLRLYYRLSDAVAGFSLDRLKQNLTLANSDWTAAHVRRVLGIPAQTVYPPVVDPAAGLPWCERRTGFLAVGRISPEKEYERAITILARVREHVPALTLTIVGACEYRHYLAKLQQQARRHGAWIQFKHDISRDQLRALMATHRYGIHGMREEHFGMAPAELARAGCIVWVPRGGGQMEIVNNEPALMYDSDDDAVGKIVRTLADEAEQARLRAVLTSTERFSTQRFVDQVREIVAGFRE